VTLYKAQRDGEPRQVLRRLASIDAQERLTEDCL
jgi:hypothetical protein